MTTDALPRSGYFPRCLSLLLYKICPSWPGVVKEQGEKNSSMLGIPKGGIRNMKKCKMLFTYCSNVKLHSLLE